MRLNIHGRGVAVDGATRERVERRLGFALGRFGDRVGRAKKKEGFFGRMFDFD